MSFAIFPKAFSVGFFPKVVSSPVQNHPPNPSVESQPSQAVAVDKADLHFIKIIPDDLQGEVGNNLKKGRGTTRTRYQVDPESKDLVVRVVDETGKEVKQIPDADHLELSHRIRQYQERISADPEVD